MLDTVKRSGGADDVCRARYDCLLFALERHAADNNERKKHAAKSGTTSAARRRILELGALSLLEAELEDVRALCVGGADGKQQRDVSGYASCLEAMVDRHYDNLRELVCVMLLQPLLVSFVADTSHVRCTGGAGRLTLTRVHAEGSLDP